MPNKKEFNILVQETLGRIVTVEAENSEEAIQLVQKQYDNSEIVLDYNDLSEIEILDQDNLYA